MKPWMQTFLGNKFTFDSPRAQDIEIEDIAHSLAMQCRFNGHVKEFYSVGEHCLRVVNRVSPPNKFWGLMHEVAETYMGDIITPFKCHWRWRRYLKSMETRILKVVAIKYGLPWPIPEEIKEVDKRMWATEERDIRNKSRFEWSTDVVPYLERIVPMANWRTVKLIFIEQFDRLISGKDVINFPRQQFIWRPQL